jgi:hypothetical protein
MVLVKPFGLHWPRNQENLDEIEDLAGHKSGNLRAVSRSNAGVHRTGSDERAAAQSCQGRLEERAILGPVLMVVIGKAKSERELEALLLEALPFCVRSLKKQSGRLSRKLQVAAPSREITDVALAKLAPGRSRRKRSSQNQLLTSNVASSAARRGIVRATMYSPEE